MMFYFSSCNSKYEIINEEKQGFSSLLYINFHAYNEQVLDIVFVQQSTAQKIKPESCLQWHFSLIEEAEESLIPQ